MKITRSLSGLLRTLATMVSVGLIAVGGGHCTPSATAAEPIVTCKPGTGWQLTSVAAIPPSVELVAHEALLRLNIPARVTARGFGERDSCGTEVVVGIDFDVDLQLETDDAAGLASEIRTALAAVARPSLGWVTVRSPSGTVIRMRPDSPSPRLSSDAYVQGIPTGTFSKKVSVVVYAPFLSNGQYLSDYLGWAAHADMTQANIDFFWQASHGELSYTVAETVILSDGWPVKKDGFRYTEVEYLAAINGTGPWHEPDAVDYNAIVNDPRLDICGKANRHEIDEVWIYNGPGFGFYESTLIGPGAYWFNSGPVAEPHDCERLIPLMGPSPERPDMLGHGEGHRMESTMVRLYGGWDMNSVDPERTNWDRFALVDYQSTAYDYSGCGSIHYPPNGVSDYDYSNSSTANSNCADFGNYPDLGDPNLTVESVSCSSWNCSHFGYMGYWFGSLPHNEGCGSDRVHSNWWRYFSDPAESLDPTDGCPYPPEVSIAGQVTSGDGVPIEGAAVSLSGPANRTSTSGRDGRYAFSDLPDGTYIVAVTKSGYSSPASQQVTIAPANYDMDFVLAFPQLTLLEATFTPQTLYAGELLILEAVVLNTGDEVALTQGPPPGFVYQEGETFDSEGYTCESGKWRIGVNWGPSFPFGAYDFRWGTGSVVPPGEKATVVGYMRLLTPQVQDYWVGVVREGMGWYHEGSGRTTITVLECPLAMSTAPAVTIATFAPDSVTLTWPAVPEANHYDIYRNTSPYGDLLASVVETVQATVFEDVGVLGNPDVNYYYRLKAGVGDCHGPVSTEIGKFEFRLVQGK